MGSETQKIIKPADDKLEAGSVAGVVGGSKGWWRKGGIAAPPERNRSRPP